MHDCGRSILDETGHELRRMDGQNPVSIESYVRAQNARWHRAAITGAMSWMCRIVRSGIGRREPQPVPLRILGD